MKILKYKSQPNWNNYRISKKRLKGRKRIYSRKLKLMRCFKIS
jgi:hypothetical protein